MKNKNAFANAVVGLILNLQVFPGLGSIIAGDKKNGGFQIALSVVAILLMLEQSLIAFGALLILIAWLWALISGIKMIRATA